MFCEDKLLEVGRFNPMCSKDEDTLLFWRSGLVRDDRSFCGAIVVEVIPTYGAEVGLVGRGVGEFHGSEN